MLFRSNGSAYLIDSKELKVRQKLVGGSSSVSHLAFSPSGEWLAAGGTAPKFLLWNIDSGELIWEQAMGQFTVEGIAFDPRERFVAVTKNARGKIENQPWSQSTIEYLDAYLKKSVFEISVDRLAYSPVFTPDGGLLAWFHEEGNNVISVLEVASGKIIYRHEIGFAGGVTSLAKHPNGRWLISGHRNGMIAVWDILTGESLYKKLEPGVAFVKVATTSDGKHLLTSSGSQTKWHVGVWSFEMAPKAAKAQKGIGKTEWQDLWAALLETNTKTLSTLSKMVDHGSESVKFLETELKVDGPVVDTKSVSALIRQLGDEDFDKRQEASQALANADAADELHKALASSNPEVVYRVKKILKTHPAKSFLVKDPSEIRRLRAIQVLEYIGTEEARALTLRLAEKDSSVNVRSAARSALPAA